MLAGYLTSEGVRVPRKRLRASIHRVYPAGTEDRRRRAVRRRVYTVPCPNYIWHIDGNRAQPYSLVICCSWGYRRILQDDKFSKMCQQQQSRNCGWIVWLAHMEFPLEWDQTMGVKMWMCGDLWLVTTMVNLVWQWEVQPTMRELNDCGGMWEQVYLNHLLKLSEH